MIKKH